MYICIYIFMIGNAHIHIFLYIFMYLYMYTYGHMIQIYVYIHIIYNRCDLWASASVAYFVFKSFMFADYRIWVGLVGGIRLAA